MVLKDLEDRMDTDRRRIGDKKYEDLFCKSCNKQVKVDYIGEQYLEDTRMFDLYNCGECHTTIAANFSKEYQDKYDT